MEQAVCTDPIFEYLFPKYIEMEWCMPGTGYAELARHVIVDTLPSISDDKSVSCSLVALDGPCGPEFAADMYLHYFSTRELDVPERVDGEPLNVEGLRIEITSQMRRYLSYSSGAREEYCNLDGEIESTGDL